MLEICSGVDGGLSRISFCLAPFSEEGKLRGEDAILSKPLVANFVVIDDYVTIKNNFFHLFILKSSFVKS